MNKNKNLNFLLVFVLLIAIQQHLCSQTKNTQKPNVIIIYTDDQGYQDLGCYNSPKIKTPNIDKLAETGIRLTDFYVTASVCSASRASLLTGRYPFNNGVGGVFFPDAKGMDSDEITIAENVKNFRV